ncbi:hypothetical protein NWP09_00425 [Agrococcus sp. HG114]|nr:hypothetical protein [Agrococcus sp. HG114]
MRAVEPHDLAALDAALGFALPGSPTCGYVDETVQTERMSRMLYLEFGGQPALLDQISRQFIAEGWNALGSEGPPVYERGGVEVGFVPSPPGLFIALP